MILGANPRTSIVGYLLAILTAIKPLMDDTTVTWSTVVATAFSAIITAVFGRVAADAPKTHKPE
jgi:hypothetical protein